MTYSGRTHTEVIPVRMLCIALAAALLAIPAFADEPAKPTEESIKKLFEVAHTSSLIDTMMNQVQSTTKANMSRAFAGKELNEQQQQILSDSQTRIFDVVRQELNWKEIEPGMIEVYRDTFTQKEVDGMMKFYSSPTGKAVLDKMPQTMTAMMTRMQARMQNIVPKLQEIQRDTAEKVKAAATPADSGAAPAPQSPSPPPAH
jgi:uncharacterized protein